ncbi:MAG: hypothetical protein JW939_05040 [Candidatus Thermoplasmatota archaeon]|nr:hypothetical protein [Candidatus Thermoplasmatota archaeon]
MILDLSVMMALAPLLMLIGIALVIYGKEILDIMSFPIGALAGGILAYMIMGGLLANYDIPVWISIIVTILMAFGGGLVGKGVTAMLMALFTSTVIVDVISVFLGDGSEIILVVIGLVLFLCMIALVPRFMEVFSSFLGGGAFALGVTPFLENLDVVPARLIQFSIIIVMCVIGSIIQHWLHKKLQKTKEEINWIPSKNTPA